MNSPGLGEGICCPHKLPFSAERRSQRGCRRTGSSQKRRPTRIPGALMTARRSEGRHPPPGATPYTLNPDEGAIPSTLHPTPYTLHRKPHTTPHPKPWTLHPSSLGSPRDSESSVENDSADLPGERGSGRASRSQAGVERNLLPLPVRRSSVVWSPTALSPINARGSPRRASVPRGSEVERDPHPRGRDAAVGGCWGSWHGTASLEEQGPESPSEEGVFARSAARDRSMSIESGAKVLYPAPYTLTKSLYPAPYTLKKVLYPTPHTLHPTPYTPHTKSHIRNLEAYTLSPKPSTPNPNPGGQKEADAASVRAAAPARYTPATPTPQTPKPPNPQTSNPKPPNPKPHTPLPTPYTPHPTLHTPHPKPSNRVRHPCSTLQGYPAYKKHSPP